MGIAMVTVCVSSYMHAAITISVASGWLWIMTVGISPLENYM